MAAQSKSQKDSGPKKKGKMIDSRNDLKAETREQMAQLCNQQLADTFDLFSQTKQAHWNVKGPQFFQLHELYDELAATLLGFVDMIAERATALGGAATGTARMAAGATRLPEFPENFVGSLESLDLLCDRYASVAESTRAAIDEAEQAEDMDTADLFTEVSRELDKSLWFLESHLQMDR
jgi:starvation-inducible DNA-binding protein